MNTNNDYFEIDILQIFNAIWHRLWLVILSAIITGGILFSYASFLITPLYEAKALLYVNNSSFSLGNASFSISASELTAAKTLVDTYIVVLKTRTTLNDVIFETGINYSYDELLEMIEAKPVSNTEIFEVVVTSSNPEEAELIANTIAEILPNKIANIVDGSSVRIVDHAIVPAEKSSPNITMFTAIGILIGLVFSCMLIIIREMMDTNIHDEEYLTKTYNLPILATIPDLFEANSSGYYSSYANANNGKKERL